MCHIHPKYNPRRRPTADCMLCWEEYLEANPETPILAKDLRRLLFRAFHAKAKAWMLRQLWKDHI